MKIGQHIESEPPDSPVSRRRPHEKFIRGDNHSENFFRAVASGHSLPEIWAMDDMLSQEEFFHRAATDEEFKKNYWDAMEIFMMSEARNIIDIADDTDIEHGEATADRQLRISARRYLMDKVIPYFKEKSEVNVNVGVSDEIKAALQGGKKKEALDEPKQRAIGESTG